MPIDLPTLYRRAHLIGGIPITNINLGDLARDFETHEIVLKTAENHPITINHPNVLEGLSRMGRDHAATYHPTLLEEFPLIRRLEDYKIVEISDRNSQGAHVLDMTVWRGPAYGNTSAIAVRTNRLFEQFRRPLYFPFGTRTA